MATSRLELTRAQILSFRRRVGTLDKRLPSGPSSLRRSAWAGIQDSMPRAALLSINARVEGTEPRSWDDPSLVQLWGPRYSAYVVAADDLGVFSVGRLPDDGKARMRAEDLAARLRSFLGDRKVAYGEVERALGLPSNMSRYAATTGTVVMRWEGARQPVIWTMPPPEVEPGEARSELARRYLHIFGPATSPSFAKWAGVPQRFADGVFDSLKGSLVPVETPVGDAWILNEDEIDYRAGPGPEAPARLLPSGDAYFLLQDEARELLVTNPEHRAELWTPRVWPGALLVGGEIAGTWRRAGESVTIRTWRVLSAAEREAVEREAAALPLPDIKAPITVRWDH